MSNEKPIVEPEELAAAETEAEAETGTAYTYTLRKPFTYEGQTYTTLTMDFDKLTGRDGIAIANELASRGRTAPVPALSPDYLARMVCRACDPPLAVNVLEAMPLFDFNSVTARARSFLLRSES